MTVLPFPSPASVGFESMDYVVEESTGHVQVCVRSEGYGFNLTLSASSSNPAGKYVHMYVC